MFFSRKQPKITIQYGRLLDPVFTFYCKNNPEYKKIGWNDWTPPTEEVVIAKMKELKNEWKNFEPTILKNLEKISGLKFQRDIDVYIVSGTPRSISNPIIIKSSFSKSEFTLELTHELIHALFGQNANILSKYIYRELSPNETESTAKHVIVHALLKYIFADILRHNEVIEESIARAKKHSTNDYSRAWEIVEEMGHLNLIESFKQKYNHPTSIVR